jgi:transposase
VFVRKKKNPSGVVSVQVIAKEEGKSKLVKTIGHSSDVDQIEFLVEHAHHFIESFGGQTHLDFSDGSSLKTAFNRITSHTQAGTELLLGKIFDEIGFNQIRDTLFRKLILARLCYPDSKLSTSSYLQRYHGLDVPVEKIYRYMDKLHKSQKELVQTISYEHTLHVMDQQIRVVFYDVTTIYFEIDNEDELRKTGFSKEGKHQNPQIVLGLLVSKYGYPLAYEIFEGNKFEGHTMLPIIEAFRKKYNIGHLVIIADSGLLSKPNVEQLCSGGYEFILGARIKNEGEFIKQKILSLKLNHGESEVIEKGHMRLIVSYSEDRAKKDRYNREKGIRKLEKQLRKGKLTKASINNKGYNKFLKPEGEIKIEIDKQKCQDDVKWDGLKGYLTNAKLDKSEVIENYKHLWQIEKAFRIAKSDLKIRPVYHHIQRRIEAHICLAFVAYKVYKELERQLKIKKHTMSPEKAIEVAKTIYQIEAKDTSGHIVKHLLMLTDEQRQLMNCFELNNFG